MRQPFFRTATIALAGLVFSTLAAAQNWPNGGGNAGRNGLTSEIGPDAATPIWSVGRPSIIAWQPVIDAGRVFVVRQTGFPPEPNSDESPVVAMDLDTGMELWFANIPAAAGDWTTWIAGARDGRVYASRSGNGSSVSAKIHALDAATGATLWMSQDVTSAGAYDGVVFADNGDLIVGDFRNVTRIRAVDGTTAWRVARTCSVSSSCGACTHGAGVYIADAVGGGNRIRKLDAATGAFQYASPTLTGFTLQNTPMASHDGTIYLSRTQNNVATDFFYAINDSGTAMTIRWSVPARWTVVSEFAVAADGAVFMLAPGNVVQKLDALTGNVLATSVPLASEVNMQPRMAVDALGRLYVSSGTFSNGTFYAFDANLALLWSTPVANINIGAPAVGRDGTLVIAGIGTDVRALRTPRLCDGDVDGDNDVDLTDLATLLANFGISGATREQGDLNGDTIVDLSDLSILLANFGSNCP
jgi:PQQ-like domain